MLDSVTLSHALQNSQFSLETRLALILLNHGYTLESLTHLVELPTNISWIAFEKPFVKTFKNYHKGPIFTNLNLDELTKTLATLA